MALSRSSSSNSLAGPGQLTRPNIPPPTFEDRLMIGLAGLATIQNAYRQKQNNEHLFGLYALEEDFRDALEQCILDTCKPKSKIQREHEIRKSQQNRKEQIEHLEARYNNAIKEKASLESVTPKSFANKELRVILSKQSIRVQGIIQRGYDNIFDKHKAAVEAVGKTQADCLCFEVIVQHKAAATETCAGFKKRAKTGITQDNSPDFLKWYREVQEYQSKTTENASLIIRNTHR